MTVLTMPAQPQQDSRLRPVPWRRMVWVTWRQHRPTLLSMPAVLGVVALYLLIAGLKFHHDYAALAACHARALVAADTDWIRIATLYRVLASLAPSPVIELNRAVAVSMADGPAAGLAIVDTLAGYYIAPDLKEVVYFGIFLLILVLRPTGLFGVGTE